MGVPALTGGWEGAGGEKVPDLPLSEKSKWGTLVKVTTSFLRWGAACTCKGTDGEGRRAEGRQRAYENEYLFMEIQKKENKKLSKL